MKEYLSTETIWLHPTPEILALNGKRLLIVDADSKISTTLRVEHADPEGFDTGKCSVMAWRAFGQHLTWQDVTPSQVPPTDQIRQWQRFLNQDALDLIRRNDDPPRREELTLVVPNT